MAIAFDAATSFNGGASQVSSVTFAHTVGSGANRILVVGVALRNGTGQSVTGVTYNGVAMTSAGVAINGTTVRTSLWTLVNPASGTHDVVVSMSAAAVVAGGAHSYTGVDQTTPIGTAATATGNSNAPSVNVSSATDQLVVDSGGHSNSTSNGTVGSGQTQSYHDKSTGAATSNVVAYGSREAGAPTVTMSWSTSDSNARPWAIVGVPLRPAFDYHEAPSANPGAGATTSTAKRVSIATYTP